MAVFEFDVAVVPAALTDGGHRDISRPTWVHVVLPAEFVWRAPLVRAHLTAAQMVGVHGMVIDVLYRE